MVEEKTPLVEILEKRIDEFSPLRKKGDVREADTKIFLELEESNVVTQRVKILEPSLLETLEKKDNHLIETHIHGEVNGWTVRRGHCYYVLKPKGFGRNGMPAEMAQELHNRKYPSLDIKTYGQVVRPLDRPYEPLYRGGIWLTNGCISYYYVYTPEGLSALVRLINRL